MNNLRIKNWPLVALAAVALTFGACKKDEMPAVEPQPNETVGVYVLCEGPFGQSNKSTITYYDFATKVLETDYFKKQNGTDLGTGANDLKQYGSKMYCVVTGTDYASRDSYIEVINISTGKSLKRIPFFDTNSGFLPRFITFYKNKAYVSSYDGYLTRIDTASLAIETRIKVGGALEQLATVNGKMYVTNSDRFPYATENNSAVSVVDLNTFSKIKDIAVGLNPTKISATNQGDLFVVTRGNYGDILPTLDKLSSVTDIKLSSSPLDVEYLNITNSRGFVIGPYGNAFLKTIDVSSGVLGANFVTDQTIITAPYSVTVNHLNDDTFVADALSFTASKGKMYAFGKDGKKKLEFTTGSFPQSAVFKYSYK